MKVRLCLALIVIAAFAGGLAWYITSPADSDAVKLASASKSDGAAATGSPTGSPKPTGSGNPNGGGNTSATESSRTETSIGAQALSPSNGDSGAAGANTSDSNTAASGPNATGAAPNGGGAAGTPTKGIHFAGVPAELSDFATSRIATVMSTWHRGMSADGVQLETPLPVYRLYTALAKGENPDGMAFNNSYYYLMNNSGQIIDGFGVISTNSGPSMFMPHSTFYAQISAGLQYLAGLPQVRADSYEARLAQTDGTTVVIWLKSESGGADLYYTVMPVPVTPQIPANTLLSADDFVGVVGTYLQKQLQAFTARGARGGQ